MELTFHSLDELQAFTAWVNGATMPATVTHQVGELARTVTVAVTPAEREALADAIEASLGDENRLVELGDAERQPEGEVQCAGEPTKRKRRTKAEIEAAKAAEQAPVEEPKEVTPASTVAETAPENKGNPFAQQTLPAGEQATGAPPTTEKAATVEKGDLAEFLTARLAERPTMEQIEHMKYARAFIAKFDLNHYNTAFELAGLTPNVMSYSTADCARHAAVLDYLSL